MFPMYHIEQLATDGDGRPKWDWLPADGEYATRAEAETHLSILVSLSWPGERYRVAETA